MIDTVPVTDAPHGSGIKSQLFEVYDLSVDEVCHLALLQILQIKLLNIQLGAMTI